MAYAQLFAGIVVEIFGTSLLKTSNGFSKLIPTICCVTCYLVAFWLVAQSVKTLPVGYAYAVWSGVGTVAISLIGAIVYAEGFSVGKAVGILLVVAGVVTLNLAGAA